MFVVDNTIEVESKHLLFLQIFVQPTRSLAEYYFYFKKGRSNKEVLRLSPMVDESSLFSLVNHAIALQCKA